MESINRITKKIKFFALLSFFLPLIAINLCWLLYATLGTINAYIKLGWSENFTVDIQKFAEVHGYTNPVDLVNPIEKKQDEYINFSFTDCPKFKTKIYHNSKNRTYSTETEMDKIKEQLILGEIVSVTLKYTDQKNYRCVKNHPFIFNILKISPSLENQLVKFKKSGEKKYGSGFAKIKNPYFYGEVSISRTARYYPATMIFKPLIILAAIFLLFYWKNNSLIFHELREKKIIENFSNKFLYFGYVSCIFLILHALFLGVDLRSDLFDKLRRLILILFIVFEVSAQLSLTMNLYKLKEKIKDFAKTNIVKIKFNFVRLIILITVISFFILIFFDTSRAFNHILEWNYFSILLIYYFLTRLMWR